MSKELKKIQLTGAALDYVITHEIERKQMIAEARALMDKLEAEAKAAHQAHWAKLEEFFPETKDGDWQLDLEYMDNNIIFLKQKEDSDSFKKLADFLGLDISVKA